MKIAKLLTQSMTRTITAILTSSILLLATLGGNLHAQKNNKDANFYFSPVQNPETIANYPLDLAFLDKIEAIQQDIIAKSITLTAQDTGNDESVSGLINAINNHKALKDILNQHQLSAENYVTGYMALQAALAAASALEDTESIFDESETVSKQNLSFAQKNGDRIRKLLENSL